MANFCRHVCLSQGNFVTAAKDRMEMCIQWTVEQHKRSTERWRIIIRSREEKIQDSTRYIKRLWIAEKRQTKSAISRDGNNRHGVRNYVKLPDMPSSYRQRLKRLRLPHGKIGKRFSYELIFLSVVSRTRVVPSLRNSCYMWFSNIRKGTVWRGGGGGGGSGERGLNLSAIPAPSYVFLGSPHIAYHNANFVSDSPICHPNTAISQPELEDIL